jgi:hypothetical protein
MNIPMLRPRRRVETRLVALVAMTLTMVLLIGDSARSQPSNAASQAKLRSRLPFSGEEAQNSVQRENAPRVEPTTSPGSRTGLRGVSETPGMGYSRYWWRGPASPGYDPNLMLGRRWGGDPGASVENYAWMDQADVDATRASGATPSNQAESESHRLASRGRTSATEAGVNELTLEQRMAIEEASDFDLGDRPPRSSVEGTWRFFNDPGPVRTSPTTSLLEGPAATAAQSGAAETAASRSPATPTAAPGGAAPASSGPIPY